MNLKKNQTPSRNRFFSTESKPIKNIQHLRRPLRRLICTRIFQIENLFLLHTANHIDRANLRSNGLIFYDLKTNRTLLPPIVTPLKYTQSSRLPLIGRPCSCQTLNCGCCAGMSIQQFNFNQHRMQRPNLHQH